MNLKSTSILVLSAVILAVVVMRSRTRVIEAESAAGDSAPFATYRSQAPGVSRKITVADLPKPYASESIDNGPDPIDRPSDAWPQAPAGFKVEQYARELDNPRLLRTAPN